MTTKEQRTRLSKFLSLLLRHKPETIGIKLDENGWTEVPVLLEKMAAHNELLSMRELEELVATNEKKRFAFNDDKTKIRASQGHSVSVELQLSAQRPPLLLFHGTVAASIESIMRQGLMKMSRQHVHLSADEANAYKVGVRRGKPIILRVQSGIMWQEGYQFFLSENGVWLTEQVPAKFISF